MNKIINLLIILITFGIMPCFSQIYGEVVDPKGNPIVNVQVFLIEKEESVLTDQNGNFVFRNINKGEYTILFISQKYKEKEIKIKTPIDNKITVALSPVVIDMGKITLSSKTYKEQSPDEVTFNKNEIERIPTGGNPFHIIEREGGIVPTSISNNDTANITLHLPYQPFLTEKGSGIPPINYSFFGSDPTWTRYYYDYIEIPRTSHIYGFPFPPSVLQQRSIDSIKFWKGTLPVSIESSNSSVIDVFPLNKISENSIVITPSVVDISFLLKKIINENSGILLGLRKSLFEVTVWPILDVYTGINEYSGYGDFLFRYLYNNKFDYLSLDALTFFDYYMSNSNYQGQTKIYEENWFSPICLGLGANWKRVSLDDLINTISIALTFSNTNKRYLRGSTINSLEIVSDTKLNNMDLSFKEKLLWIPIDFYSINIGLLLNHSIGNAYYKDSENDYPEKNTEIQSTRISPFIENTISLETFTFTLGLLLAFDKNIKYKINSTLNWSISDEIGLSLVFGKGPVYISPLNKLTKYLNESLMDIQSSDNTIDPESAFSSLKIFCKSKSNLKLSLTGYYAYYWDIAGINSQTSYYNWLDLGKGIIFADSGRSYGLDFSGSFGNMYRNIYLDYTLSWTKYHNSLLGWIRANSDIRHSFKLSAYSNIYNWLIGFNFMLFLNKPFTPIIVDSVEYNTDETVYPVYKYGKFNSGTDNIPRFRFDISISKKLILFKKKVKIFINTTNLLVFLNPFLEGLKDEYKTTIGATTANEEMRQYVFDDSFSLIGSNLGISIKL